MKAMVLKEIRELGSREIEHDYPLEMMDLPIPSPGVRELLVRVSVCGVCHTELDEIEGRLIPPKLPVIPGHEIVGKIEKAGPGADKYAIGTRVGVREYALEEVNTVLSMLKQGKVKGAAVLKIP